MNEQKILENLKINIRALMQEYSLTTEQLAEYTGLTSPIIRNLKDGKLKKINIENVLRISTYFHVSPSELMGDDVDLSELNIVEEFVEFPTSFYEREANDFIQDNGCKFCFDDDPELCELVYNTIHPFVEAHQYASGYYYQGISRERIKNYTEEVVDSEYTKIIFDEVFGEDENLENSKTEVCLEEDINLVTATALSVTKMRERYGLSRNELAKKTGLSGDCIYRIEHGDNKNINFDHINRIARELLCSPDFLIGESCDPTANRDGKALFYPIESDLYFKYVQLGHDLSYAVNYMDKETQKIIASIINSFNRMYKIKRLTMGDRGKRLSMQEVYFREQEEYMEKYKNRGAHFYTKKYSHAKSKLTKS